MYQTTHIFGMLIVASLEIFFRSSPLVNLSVLVVSYLQNLRSIFFWPYLMLETEKYVKNI